MTCRPSFFVKHDQDSLFLVSVFVVGHCLLFRPGEQNHGLNMGFQLMCDLETVFFFGLPTEEEDVDLIDNER